MTLNLYTTANDRMKQVKAACDKAPAGPAKDAALAHYRQAESALAAKNDPDCLKALGAATKALAGSVA